MNLSNESLLQNSVKAKKLERDFGPTQYASMEVDTSKNYLPNELLQMYRHRAKITQQELASHIGLKHRRMVQAWEVGESLPTAERLRKIIEFYLLHDVFSEGQEQTEAKLLWNSIKTFFENTRQHLSIFPIFDEQWFSLLLAQRTKNADLIANGTPKVTTSDFSSKDLSDTTSDELLGQKLLNRFPAVMNRLLGREEEIAYLSKLLTPISQSSEDLKTVSYSGTPFETRLITLVGLGGIGKTRLALEVANRLFSTYVGNIVWFDLSSLANSEVLLPALAQLLNIKLNAGDTNHVLLQKIIAHFRNYIKYSGFLLIMDNFEHLLPAAPILEELLTSTPELKIVVTSREPLEIYGEQLYHVEPLELPSFKSEYNVSGDDEISFTTMKDNAAIQLFVERLCLVHPGFILTKHNIKLIARLCVALEGIPLAIELAAAQGRVFSLEQLLIELETTTVSSIPATTKSSQTGGEIEMSLESQKMSQYGRFDLLVNQRLVGSHQRQNSLRAVLMWSYAQLKPFEQKLFQQLAILPGSWTVNTALAVLNINIARIDFSSNLSSIEVREEVNFTYQQLANVIQTLLNKSLLYEKVPKISVAICEQLLRDIPTGDFDNANFSKASSENPIKFRMLEVVREFALEVLVKEQGVDELEVLNQRHALYCCRVATQAEVGLEEGGQHRWLESLDRLLPNMQYALAWCLSPMSRQVVEETKNVSIQNEFDQRTSDILKIEIGLEIINGLRMFWELRSYWRQAYDYVLALLKKIEFFDLDKKSLTTFKDDQIRKVNSVEDKTVFNSKEEEKEELNNSRLFRIYARAKFTMSWLALQLGNLNQAEDRVLESLEQAKNLADNKFLVIQCLTQLGYLKITQEKLDEARQFYQQAYKLIQEQKDKDRPTIPYQTSTVANNGYFAYSPKIEDKQLLTLQRLEGIIIHGLGDVAQLKGEYSTAKDYYEHTAAIFEELKIKSRLSMVYNNMAALAATERDTTRAKTLYQRSLAIKKEQGNKKGIAVCYLNIGQIEHCDFNYSNADKYFQEGIILFRETGFNRGLVSTLSRGIINKLLLNDTDQMCSYLIEVIRLTPENFPTSTEQYLIISGITILLFHDNHLRECALLAGVCKKVATKVHNLLLSSGWSELYDGCMEKIKHNIGNETYEALFNIGELSELDQLIMIKLRRYFPTKEEYPTNKSLIVPLVSETICSSIKKLIDDHIIDRTKTI
jgi:predicted ATPase/tetratricopeptide (TPR) repeat protein/DNA-binding XRE family transcriptional regulator